MDCLYYDYELFTAASLRSIIAREDITEDETWISFDVSTKSEASNVHIMYWRFVYVEVMKST